MAFALDQRHLAEVVHQSASHQIPLLPNALADRGSADDGHRALRVCGHVLADRTEHEAPEASVAAGTHYEEIGRLRLFDQDFRWIAMLDVGLNEHRRVLAQDLFDDLDQIVGGALARFGYVVFRDADAARGGAACAPKR